MLYAFNKRSLSKYKYDMRNLVNFHPITQKYENFFSMGSSCTKYILFELQKYRGIIFHDIGQWRKIWINRDLMIAKMTWEIGWTFTRALKSPKNCTLMSSFCPKHVSARKCHRNYVSWHWRLMQNFKENRLVALKMT